MFYENDDEVFAIEPDSDMVPLDSGDPEFIRGIEVGYMMALAFYGFLNHMKVHISNTEMVMRIAEAYDLSFTCEDADEVDMVIVTLVPPALEDYDDDDED